MNFADFQHSREKILRDGDDLLDCSATNLYAALAHLIPAPSPLPEKTIHRCHLASEWTEHFRLPPETSRYALVSCGVRDSLARLFRHYQRVDARLWIPADNYPIYAELARRAGLDPCEFPTLPQPVWPDNQPNGRPEILLVTNPLKPLGRFLSANDTSALIAWLQAASSRRLILDAVYDLNRPFHSSTRNLLASGQVILLHSLTKGWLHPRLFGVALVPQQDTAALSDLFRAEPPPQSNLARARELMAHHAEMPSTIAREIAAARARLLAAWAEPFPGISDRSEGYFLPVAGKWSDLLEARKVLGLPASVFGSSHDNITILSCINFLA